MRVRDFDFELPRELIAQRPAERRDGARLFVHDAPRDASEHRRVVELPELLRAGDLLVLNDTRVRQARLFARRASGARFELLFLGPEQDGWRALVNPARKLRPGERLVVERHAGGATDVELEALRRLPHDAEPEKPGPAWILAFRGELGQSGPAAAAAREALFEAHGHVPLPPYITRHQGRSDEEEARERLDRERYQTVFAREPGAVAAPTAGLHLSEDLLERLAAAGVERTSVTLHVGLGTFAPIEVEDTDAHPMHAERYELGPAAVAAIEATRTRGGRVVCVGTTAVRVLESCSDAAGRLCAGSGETRLFLTPGSPFRVCDLLLTNFHLPKSTLLMLVAAFIGRERVLRLYREAIEERYRFFSYGDAMLLFGDARRWGAGDGAS